MSVAIEVVESSALAGNPLGNPTARRVAVWLPPSYARTADRRYPLILWLAGHGGTGELMFSGTPWQPGLGERLDALVAAGKMGEVIVAAPDCFTGWGGAQYLDSPALGRYETHLIQEIIRALDGRLRTVPDRAARAVGGKSSGGFGALVLAMRHPDLFSAVASHAGDMAFELSLLPDLPVAARTLRRHGGITGFLADFRAREKKSGDAFTTMMVLATAGAYSPDARREHGIELPFDLDTGEIRLGRVAALEGLGPGRAGRPARRGAARDEADLPGRRHARRAQPGPGRAHLRAPAARAGHCVPAPGVRRRPPVDRLPVRRLAAAAGGRARRDAGRLSAMRAGDDLTLHCHDLDDEGSGLGEIDGTTLHVPGALPAEEVAARVAHVSPHAPVAWGELQSVVSASPDRRAPVCPGFGRCGGCAIQHLAYDAQLVWKRARVVRAFAAEATLREVAVAHTVPSPRLFGYRNNAKLVAARQGRSVVLGGYAPRSHQVVDLLGCRVVEPALDAVAVELRRLLAETDLEIYDERTLAGRLRHVVLRSNEAGQVLCTLVVVRPLPDGAALAERLRAARPEVAGIVEHENRSRGNAIFAAGGAERLLAGAGEIEDRLALEDRSLRVRLTPGAFFQANRDVAALAYSAIARALAVESTQRVVDVYSGVGGIGLALANRAADVLGIESHAGAVANASAAAALNGITNARFVAGDAAAALAAVDRADVVVVNPPRKGCAPDVLAQMTRLAPRAIAYLSCEPDTLARDLAVLMAAGYRPRAITPYDMLPHTAHVETLAILGR